MAMLELRDVHTYYGNIEALKGISLHVDRGEIVTLIGANGAGKTTTLNTISGLLHPRHGSVWFEDVRIDQLRPHDVVGMGISQSPEGRRVFSRLTVLDNLEMGAYARTDKAAIQEDLSQVFALFPVLEERQRQVAGTLSGGEQQMLSMGRALMAEPQVLLLDEPSMGLAPMLVEAIFQTVQDINRRGTPILLVEQNAAMALSVADRAYVLETGRIVLEGTAQEVLDDPQVKAAYLGEI